jgi:signal peptidase I
LQGNSSFGNAGTGSFLFSHGINTTTGAYDIAEDYPTRDDTLQPGDLVAIDPNETGFVKKATGDNRETVIGIYSSKPALRLSQQDAFINGGRAIPVALAGRVPVKVSTANGTIKAGDLLTISDDMPGVAVKATTSGAVVARALESYNGPDVGTLVAFVNISQYHAEGPQATAQFASVQAGSISTDTLQAGTISAISLNVSGNATVNSLTVIGSATLGSLKVTGLTEVANILVNGHVITAGDTPVTEVMTALGPGAGVTIDGNDTAGTLTITTGSGGLTAGDLAKISFKQAFGKAPKIILSAQDDASQDARIFPSGKTKDNYILKTGQVLPANTTYTFDYFIVQ